MVSPVTTGYWREKTQHSQAWWLPAPFMALVQVIFLFSVGGVKFDFGVCSPVSWSLNRFLPSLRNLLKAFKKSEKVILDALFSLASHGWHGNSRACHGGILSLPLRCHRLDLSVELNALEIKESTALSATELTILFKCHWWSNTWYTVYFYFITCLP